MQIKNEVWILADNRPGTFSQSIGLAEELGSQYKIITLSYSFLSHLPNLILPKSLLRIKNETRNKILQNTYFPKIVISAGRRSAPIALALKSRAKKHGLEIFVIQIMNPNLRFSEFDFVILPTHDRNKISANLIETIGSLTRIDEKRILQEKLRFSEFSQISNPKIALLVGGNGKNIYYNDQDIIDLAKTASNISNNMNSTLLVLNSRRTGAHLTKILRDHLSCDFKFYDWEKLDGANPYLAILAESDFFIVTGDSVSMISECASTGKPVYIFDQNKISSPKHRLFHQDLFNKNFAKQLLKNFETLEKFSEQKLEETKRVAKIIANKIKLD